MTGDWQVEPWSDDKIRVVLHQGNLLDISATEEQTLRDQNPMLQEAYDQYLTLLKIAAFTRQAEVKGTLNHF